MKKIISIVASCFLLVFCFTLVSCGATKVSGTYKLYQVITIEGQQTSVESLTDEGTELVPELLVIKFNKDGTCVETDMGDTENAANETWKLEGSVLTLTTVVEEGEEAETKTLYANGDYLYYTTQQTETKTVVVVLKKEPFKISSLFKKKAAAETPVTTSTEDSATTSV